MVRDVAFQSPWWSLARARCRTVIEVSSRCRRRRQRPTLGTTTVFAVREDDSAARSRSLEDDEDVLLALISRGDGVTGLGLSPAEEDQVVVMVGALESRNRTRNPARSTRMYGEWNLCFTNAPSVRKNKVWGRTVELEWSHSQLTLSVP